MVYPQVAKSEHDVRIYIVKHDDGRWETVSAPLPDHFLPDEIKSIVDKYTTGDTTEIVITIERKIIYWKIYKEQLEEYSIVNAAIEGKNLVKKEVEAIADYLDSAIDRYGLYYQDFIP